MKIAFFTGHIAGEPRKASVTLLAGNLARLDWEVRIVTVGYSWLTLLKGDTRYPYARTLTPNLWFSISPRLKGYLGRTLLNPSRLPARWLNTLAKPFFRWYSGRITPAVAKEVRDSDVIVIESGPGLLLVPALRRLLPQAHFVYMVSDRLATLRVNPVIMDAEKNYLPEFELVVAPSTLIASDYVHPNCHFIPQGVDIEALDRVTRNPYQTSNNIISVGDMLFHEEVVAKLARENPDWTIHLFGDKARIRESLPNVVAYGETPFETVLPYIKFADIGLAPYRPAPGVEYISQSSLKLKQYTYARLPILAPDFAAASYANILAYDPYDLASLKPAMQRAQTLDRSAISVEGIKSWPEMAQTFINVLRKTIHSMEKR